MAREYFAQEVSTTELMVNSLSSNILLYKTKQGEARIEVVFNNETFWMSQKRMAVLYGVEVPTINYHLSQIYESGELTEQATIRKIPIVQMEGNREVNRPQMLYNLDAIIAVGYRVNSYQATQFRIWATSVLKEMIVKGFVLDDERLKQGKHFGKDYFDDLLERIREIRASERRYYQKITDIYSECSVDYDPKAETTQLFFKMVQNMMHWAVTHQTAAEIIYTRADAEMPHNKKTCQFIEKLFPFSGGRPVGSGKIFFQLFFHITVRIAHYPPLDVNVKIGRSETLIPGMGFHVHSAADPPEFFRISGNRPWIGLNQKRHGVAMRYTVIYPQR